VWATPAPTHGPSLLAAIAGAEPGDAPVAQYRRALAAIASRRAELADPSGTSIVSAADADGNAVVVVHSNSYPRYGSGLVVADYDLVLANRAGRGFSAEPGHPNFPSPGRRPATTLHAWALADEAGTPRLLGGTPGGDNQMTWNVQLLQNALDDLSPGAMVTAPRWEWLPADDGVRIEAGFETGDDAALRAETPRAISTGRWGLPCAQQVLEVRRPGHAVTGAADPRTVGAAVGV
jgi:gamma-glutamyltranspeptidase/glutathione hydrolase